MEYKIKIILAVYVALVLQKGIYSLLRNRIVSFKWRPTCKTDMQAGLHIYRVKIE